MSMLTTLPVLIFCLIVTYTYYVAAVCTHVYLQTNIMIMPDLSPETKAKKEQKSHSWDIKPRLWWFFWAPSLCPREATYSE